MITTKTIVDNVIFCINNNISYCFDCYHYLTNKTIKINIIFGLIIFH